MDKNFEKFKEWVLSRPQYNGQRQTVVKNYPEYAKIIGDYKGKEWTTHLYMFLYSIPQPTCLCCGKPIQVFSLTSGPKHYCSGRCAGQHTKEQVRQTHIQKYGGIGLAGSYAEKIKTTCLERYGVENPHQNINVVNKSKTTCLERYGVENPSQTDVVKQKKIKTTRIHFGVDNPFQAKEVKQKIREFNESQLKEKHSEIISTDGTKWICKCPHPECNKCAERVYETFSMIQHDRKLSHTELCTRIQPINQRPAISSQELIIRGWLDEWSIPYECNTPILAGKHIDIYIPTLKIGIECNGTYWHSTRFKDKTYHINKYKCAEEHDIRLLQIWDDWMINKLDIIKSIIKSKLGVIGNKIYARQCEIKEVNSREASLFLQQNHIQGKCKSTIRIGLYKDEQLVSLMSFNPSRKHIGSHNCIELVRFCNKLDTLVVGGASRLFKYFIEHYAPTQIISFSSNDISDGRLYKVLGFVKTSESHSYWYINPNTCTRYHRLSFTKSRLIKMGADPSKTEIEIMREWGYNQIYDSGQQCWVFTPL